MAYNTNQTAPSSIELPITENIQNKIGNISEQVGALRSRLSELRNRAIGNEPSKGEAPAVPRPVPNGKLNSIMISLGDLAGAIEECHQVASQLERIA